MVPIASIKIDTTISALIPWPDSENEVSVLAQEMAKHGYDAAFPVVLWDQGDILVDGRLRYEAARKAGISEVPAIRKGFASLDAACAFAIRAFGLRHIVHHQVAMELLRYVQEHPPGPTTEAEVKRQRASLKRRHRNQSEFLDAFDAMSQGIEEDLGIGV